MQMTPSSLLSLLPVELDIIGVIQFVGVFAIFCLIISLIGRRLFGPRSSFNHAVSTSFGILALYALTATVYTFDPAGLSRFLAPLPFVTFQESTLTVFSFANEAFPDICSQLLSMVILVLLYNLLDHVMPRGKKVPAWFFWRFVTVSLAILLHYGVTGLFNSFLPGVLVAYAPTILLSALILSLFLGALKLLLGLVLTVVNPIIGALYAFFFSSKFGKSISQSVLTTAILSIVIAAADHFGCAVISISSTALIAYIPMLAVALLLWYLIGHKL